MAYKLNSASDKNIFIDTGLCTGKRERIVPIDAIRGIAIIMMVFSHGLHWFYTGRSHDIISLFAVNSIGDMATPFFYTISGAALYLSIVSRLKPQADSGTLIAIYAKKFSQLFFIGAALSKTWGVLQAQAVSLFLVTAGFLLAGKSFSLPKTVGFIFAGGLIIMAGHYAVVGLLPGCFFTVFLRGSFPLLAVTGLNALGFYLGHRLKNKGLGFWTAKWGLPLLSAGLLINRYLQPIRRIDMSLSFVLSGIGAVLLLLYVLNLPGLKGSLPVTALVNVGRQALFIFTAHYIVFFVPLYVFGLLGIFDRTMSLLLSGLLTFGIIRMAAWQRNNSNFTVYGIMDSIYEAISVKAAWWPYLPKKYLPDKAGAGHGISEG